MTGEQVASVGKALGHPARVAILEFFKECRPHIAGEVVAQLPLAQSTVSEHLRILREADLLFSTEDGPRTWFCMRRSVLHRFSQAVETLTEESHPAIVRLVTPGTDT
jgi:ArsR family transcriptional regulator